MSSHLHANTGNKITELEAKNIVNEGLVKKLLSVTRRTNIAHIILHLVRSVKTCCVSFPISVLGTIRSAVGSAQLLISQKFEQFRGLCNENLVSSFITPSVFLCRLMLPYLQGRYSHYCAIYLPVWSDL